MDQALSHIKDNLRGSNICSKKRHRLARENYNHQVDLYIEVDQGLVNANGGLPNTINYVNSLVTGANTIFEVSVLDVHFLLCGSFSLISISYDGLLLICRRKSILI